MSLHLLVLANKSQCCAVPTTLGCSDYPRLRLHILLQLENLYFILFIILQAILPDGLTRNSRPVFYLFLFLNNTFKMYSLVISHFHIIYFDHIHPPLSPSNSPNCPTLFPSQIHALLFVVNNNLSSPVSVSHM